MIDDKFKNAEGREFSAKIDKTPVIGKVHIEKERVYLCQNQRNGASCENKLGYKYSWGINDGGGLSYYNVTDFKFIDKDPNNPDIWEVGDLLIREVDSNPSLKIECILGNAVITTDTDKKETAYIYSKKELLHDGYKLHIPEPKPIEELVHLTLEDISNGKGVGIPSHLIRIKK